MTTPRRDSVDSDTDSQASSGGLPSFSAPAPAYAAVDVRDTDSSEKHRSLAAGAGATHALEREATDDDPSYQSSTRAHHAGSSSSYRPYLQLPKDDADDAVDTAERQKSSGSALTTPSSSRRGSLLPYGEGGIGAAGLRSLSNLALHAGLSAAAVARQKRQEYWRSAGINILLIAAWYTCSMLMSVYNSWLFSKKRYGFSYPLFVTSMHMVVQFVLTTSVLFGVGSGDEPSSPHAAAPAADPRGRCGCCACLTPEPATRDAIRRWRKKLGLERPRLKGLYERRSGFRRPRGMRNEQDERSNPDIIDWATKVLPCAVATATDIGLSNLSLKTITLTFYTMCKSSNLAFVLLFAFLFKLEVVRLWLIGIIAMITIGVVMMVAAETQFVLEGAVEVLTASAMGGLRWALTQILLDRESMGMTNPLSTIWWLSPPMALSMLTMSFAVEDLRAMFSSERFFGDVAKGATTMLLTFAPGIVALCMNLVEFALIRRTSVVTLSVAGIFKEVFTIVISSTLFGDELTPINITGLCVALLGIALYNYFKYRLLTKPHGIVGTTSHSGPHARRSYLDREARQRSEEAVGLESSLAQQGEDDDEEEDDGEGGLGEDDATRIRRSAGVGGGPSGGEVHDLEASGAKGSDGRGGKTTERPVSAPTLKVTPPSEVAHEVLFDHSEDYDGVTRAGSHAGLAGQTTRTARGEGHDDDGVMAGSFLFHDDDDDDHREGHHSGHGARRDGLEGSAIQGATTGTAP